MKDFAGSTVPLGSVIELQSGFAFKSADYQDKGHFLVRIANVQDGFLSLEKPKYVALDAKTERFALNAGDILTSLTGNIGRVTEVKEDHLPAALNQRVARITPKEGAQIDRRYLLRFLGSSLFSAYLQDASHGAAQANVSPNVIKEVPIPLPPLQEQQRIVAVLDEAFEGLARARAHAEANLQNARELFENSLEAELEAVGNSHETSLGEHIDLLAGFAFKSKGYTEDRSAMRLMRGDNIIPGAVRWEGAKYWPIEDCGAYEKFQLRADDVLIAMDRTWIKAGIKYAVLSDEDVPSLLVQRVARLRCLPSLDTHFLAMLIGSKSFERYVLSIQTGTGVPHISPTQIRDFTFPLPDIETQAKIVERLSIVKSGSNELADSYSRKLQDTDDLRQSLLQKAFAGELT